MSNFFSFLTGTFFGMYLAQNYQVPDIKTASLMIISYLKSLEKQHIKEQEQEQESNQTHQNDKYKGKYK